LARCNAWCNANRTGNQLAQCKSNCSIYWNCQGSDSTNKTCSDALGVTSASTSQVLTPPKTPIVTEPVIPASKMLKPAQ
jgi:hypothetical protein